MRTILSHQIAILLFLFSWTVYGLMTKMSDINYYGLYQVGAESLVEYNTYTLGHSVVPGWKDAGDGDVFEYRHQRFPAKQPGAFFVTATPYFFLHHFFGMSFLNARDKVSALNAWLSGALFTAATVALFYELLQLMGYVIEVSMITTFGLAFCTILLPYSGVPHHDLMATFCTLMGFFFLIRFRQTQSILDYRSAGSWLGLTLFFSMLPALIVGLIGIYGITLSRKIKDWFHLALGFLIGYLPLGLLTLIIFTIHLNKPIRLEIIETLFLSYRWLSCANTFMII
jgi:hypothetical protein